MSKRGHGVFRRQLVFCATAYTVGGYALELLQMNWLHKTDVKYKNQISPVLIVTLFSENQFSENKVTIRQQVPSAGFQVPSIKKVGIK